MIDLGEIELSGDRPEPGSLACLRHILALLSDNKTPSLSRDGVRRGTTRVDAARVHSLRFYRCADRPVLLMFSSGSSRSEEHTSELQSRGHLVCRLLLEK